VLSRFNLPLTNIQSKKITIGILRVGMKDNVAQDHVTS
jgi:hypothetical protein